MNKIVELANNIVLFLKEYGIGGLVVLFVMAHILGVIVPNITKFTPDSSNTLIVVFLYGIYFFRNKISIDPKAKKNEVQLYERKEANHLINESLLKLQRDVRADRVFVLEFHNGTHNNAKLDFAYASMNYEEKTPGLDDVADVFQKMSTSLFKYLDYMIDHRVFYGDIEEIRAIDSKLATRMENNGTKYGGCILLKCQGKLMGVLGVTFLKEPKFPKDEIKDILNKYSQEIAEALAIIRIKK